MKSLKLLAGSACVKLFRASFSFISQFPLWLNLLLRSRSGSVQLITVSFIISATIDIDLMYSWFKVQLMLPKAWILIYHPLKVKWHFLKAWHSQVCNAIPKKSFRDLSCLKVEQLYLNPRIQRALSRRIDLVMKDEPSAAEQGFFS